MKFRKWTALVAAAALVSSIAGTALAQTVPGAVYGIQGVAPGTPAPPEKIAEVQQKLQNLGVRDVPADHWAAPSLTVLVEVGFVQPDSQGNINLDADADADEGVAVFAKVLGLASATDSKEEAAEKAKEAGLVDDVPAGGLSRLDTAKMLAKALGVKPKTIFVRSQFPFNDGWNELSSEEKGILAALYEMGIFKGFPDRTFQPGSNLTKAQIAILIDRILGAGQ